MPTSGLVNTDAYVIFKYYSTHLGTSSFHHVNALRSFTQLTPFPFPRRNLQLGIPVSGSWDQGMNSDPKHLESYEAKEGAETGPACK